VCKVSKEDFEKGYRQYLKDLVKSFAGKLPEKEKTLGQLKDLHADNPNDADIAAELAEKYFLLGNKDRAKELAEVALSKQANHPRASYVKGGVLLLEKNADGAKTLLQTAAKAKSPPLNALKLLGKLEFESKNFTQAAEAFEQGRQAQPYENYWLKELARCYKQNNDTSQIDRHAETLRPDRRRRPVQPPCARNAVAEARQARRRREVRPRGAGD
jgi:uncharacterized protein HemY